MISSWTTRVVATEAAIYILVTGGISQNAAAKAFKPAAIATGEVSGPQDVGVADLLIGL